jgi:hypothetical protein
MKDSRKIVQESLNGRRPARTPIFELLCNDAVIEHFGGGRLDGTCNEQIVLRAAGNCVDAVPLVMLPDTAGRTWFDDIGHQHTAARWTEWVSKPALTDDEQWAAWALKDIERLNAEPEPRQEDLDKTMAEQGRTSSNLNGSVLAPSVGTSFNHAIFYYHCGLENFSYLMLCRPELTRTWLAAMKTWLKKYLRRHAHNAICPFGLIWSDIAYNSGLMMSRQMLADFGLFDEIAELCEIYHHRGMKVIWHSDGNIAEVIDDLVAAGVDGLNPIDAAAGLDIFELRRRYPALILTGGVPTSVLENGTAEDVRKEVRRIIDETGSEGRLLVGCSSGELPNTVPLQNFLAFYNEAMQH